jgi:hypothetical protein
MLRKCRMTTNRCTAGQTSQFGCDSVANPTSIA